MSKLLILFGLYIVLLTSCYTTSPSYFPKEVTTYVYDFRDYTAKGFLFTPENYDSDYKSIGEIQLVIEPEVWAGKHPTDRSPTKEYYAKPGQFYDDQTNKDSWSYIPINPKEILDSLYSIATNLGADAIINLRISKFKVEFPLTYAWGLKVYGFAIKRIWE